MSSMARAPTTLDSFNAIAEPRRRQVLDILAAGELQVNDMVRTLGWPQPQVSKHLGVLRRVGLVRSRRDGRRQVYVINAEKLKPIHDWVKSFERLWSRHLQNIKSVAEARARAAQSQKNSTTRRDHHG